MMTQVMRNALSPIGAGNGNVTVVVVDSMDKAMAYVPAGARGHSAFLYGRGPG